LNVKIRPFHLSTSKRRDSGQMLLIGGLKEVGSRARLAAGRLGVAVPSARVKVLDDELSRDA
jgi:hypothetical protein